MRILFLSPTFPFPANNGYKMRTWAVLRALAAEGHDTTLVSFVTPGEVDGNLAALRRVCRAVRLVPLALPSLSSGRNCLARLRALCGPLPYGVTRFCSSAMQGTIEELLCLEKFDAVFSETPFPLVNLLESLAVPLIVDNQNIEHRLLECYLGYQRNPALRAYARLECEKMRRWEKRAWSRASMSWVCSEHDQGVLTRLSPNALSVVVPNTVDSENYELSSSVEGDTLVYIGGMDWYPNRDAVEFFASEVLPVIRARSPQVKFVVAGRNPPEKFRRRLTAHAGVEFTGTVPDIGPAISKTAVCVVPLRIGSGTRLKILEAAALGKPVVSTRLGAEGLDFVDGEEIILADEPEDFGRAVLGLLHNRQLRQALGEAARRKVERSYSFPVLCRALGGALIELAKAVSFSAAA